MVSGKVSDPHDRETGTFSQEAEPCALSGEVLSSPGAWIQAFLQPQSSPQAAISSPHRGGTVVCVFPARVALWLVCVFLYGWHWGFSAASSGE